MNEPLEHNRVTAMATAPYGYGARLMALLPSIYRRYDDAWEPSRELLEKLAEEDKAKGPLRRFLEIVGSQLDQLHSLAHSALDLHDLDRVNGRLLPLLASWIAWPTDHRRELRDQRSELRKAPYLYRTVGIVPTVEATVKRVLGWESRTKEFAHNVFLSNTPERLNLWLAERDAHGNWAQPTAPLSLNYAYEGRPAAATRDGTLWLFFHTLRKASKVTWSGGQGARKSCRRGQWDIWYKTRTAEEGWSDSRPLTDNPAVDKHPSAAFWGGKLWVFWDSWSEGSGRWQLCYRTLEQGSGSRRLLWVDDVERRRPQAVVVGKDLWLFWLEREARGSWTIRYGLLKLTESGDLQLPSPSDLLAPTPDEPAIEDDLFVVFDETAGLWVFWSGRKTGESRWRIAYRIKTDGDFAGADWEAHELPADDPEANDREPAAVAEDGTVELYWSSNRERGWSVWHASLDDPENLTPRKLTDDPFSQRAPLAAGDLLFYYSNQSLTYASEIYGATRTVDGRYAGSTTVDVRNATKMALRGSFDDFQTYTFDTGARARHGRKIRYAHDTVALYVTQAGADPSADAGERNDRQRNVLERVLRQFLPIQVRAVLIIEPPPYREPVYTYDFSDAAPQRVIGELAFDRTLPESYDGLSDQYKDIAPDWVWICSWSAATPNHRSVDFAADPIDVSQRTWHVGLEPGG